MPPTLTTKSSDLINAPRFSIVTKALDGAPSEDGHRRFKATASSTITDRAGDEISLKALQQMAAKFREGVTIFTDHEMRVANAFGATDHAEIIQRGNDPKTGAAIWDLDISGKVNEPNPRMVELHDSISGGFVQLGCSIDAFVLEHQKKKSGGMSIDGLDVFSASIVGVPMNQRSWTQKAVRAIKSFHGDPENADNEEDAPVDEMHSTAPDETTPDATETVNESAEAVADPVADGDAVGKSLDTCPECGQNAETTGCTNGYHAAEKSAAESTLDVQESTQETPETASADTAETDTPEEKAAGVTDEVKELLGHVSKLVNVIGEQRTQIADLTAKVASYENQSKDLTNEVEDAKKVIARVMDLPLQAKTAGYVTEFTTAHSLFAPEVMEYLNKRKVTTS